MKQQSNPLITTILFIVALIVAACANNTTTTLPAPQSTATVDHSPGLDAQAGPPDPSAPTQETTLGDPVTLAFNPADSSLLKADREGLSRWQPGSGWQRVVEAQNPGLSGVAINPDQPATIYISGPGRGILRSDDGGDTWQEVNSGLPRLDVTALAIHSFRRDTVYAWIINDGIYRTEDGGLSWEKMPDVPIADPQVRGLTHSTLEGSMNTGWLYAATPSGAYLSMD